MFFKRSLNISELILIYFKYFYGVGYFLFKEKWTTCYSDEEYGDGPQRMFVNDCMKEK